MIYWIRMLFCKHKFEEVGKMNTFSPTSLKSDLPVKVTVTYMCTKCGKVKKINL